MVDPKAAQITVRLPGGSMRDAILAAAQADAERAMAPKPPHLMPGPELRAIVEPLMLRLLKHREEFNLWDPSGRLRRVYERFRCELEEAGFRV